jgi:chromosome partitioning protein
VLIPIQCEYYALEGLTQLIATINLVRDHLNPDLAISGVVLTMFGREQRQHHINLCEILTSNGLVHVAC